MPAHGSWHLKLQTPLSKRAQPIFPAFAKLTPLVARARASCVNASPWVPAVHALTPLPDTYTYAQLTSPSSTIFSTENCHAPSADCRTSVYMHLHKKPLSG